MSAQRAYQRARRPSHDAGTLDFTASDWGREGNDRLRSLAQLIAVAWVTSMRRPSGPIGIGRGGFLRPEPPTDPYVSVNSYGSSSNGIQLRDPRTNV